MGESVEQGRGHLRITEYLRPLSEGQVGGDDERGPLVEIIGSPETKQHMDIIGALVSMAAKIEKAAPVGGIYLGGTMERNMYTTWRQRCEPVEFDEDWPFKGHKVYRLR